jgi:hypothetical protein
MEYEGIYRKTGGSSQSKQIQQLFERGDYEAFDLADVEAFNDISSVTSTLKTYFRQLPNPLLTHALHESFVAAASESCRMADFARQLIPCSSYQGHVEPPYRCGRPPQRIA